MHSRTVTTLSLAIITALLFGLFAPASVSASPLFMDTKVGSCPGAGVEFGTIQEAVDNTDYGGYVRVCPGSYSEIVYINPGVTVWQLGDVTVDGVLVIGTPSGRWNMGGYSLAVSSHLINGGMLATNIELGACPLTLGGDYIVTGSSACALRLTLSGSRRQAINDRSPAGASIDTLELNNPTGAYLSRTAVINHLVLTSGLLELGNYDLMLTGNDIQGMGAAPGSFSVDNMVTTSGTGSLVVGIESPSVLLRYPVGNAGASPVYSPAEITYTAGDPQNFGGGIGVRVVSQVHPNATADTLNTLKRYWAATPVDLAVPFSADVMFTYDQSDVTGSEAHLIGGVYHGGTTFTPMSIDTAANTISGTVTGFSHFTAVGDGTTAVNIADAGAVLAGGAATLRWSTGSETSLVGFNVYRSLGTGGEKTLLTTSPILAQNPGSLEGAAYRWVDPAPAQGAVYWIEWLETTGTSELYGPLTPETRYYTFLTFLKP